MIHMPKIIKLKIYILIQFCPKSYYQMVLGIREILQTPLIPLLFCHIIHFKIYFCPHLNNSELF